MMHCHVESPLMLLSRNAYADGSYMLKVVVWKPWRIGEMRRPKSILHITSRARIRVPFSYSFYLFLFLLKKRSSTWFSTKMACGFRAGENYIVGSTIYIGRQLVYNNKRIHTSPGRLFLFSHDGWGEINVCPGRLSSPVRTVSRYFLNVAGQREREWLKSP